MVGEAPPAFGRDLRLASRAARGGCRGMSFPACFSCGQELGPWEGESCLTHLPQLRTASGFAKPPRWWSIADLAVAAIESEPGPISLYDIQRLIQRDLGRRVVMGSVSTVVAVDRRFCW